MSNGWAVGEGGGVKGSRDEEKGRDIKGDNRKKI